MTERDESPPSLSDIKPLSANHISTLTINNIVPEETDPSVQRSTFTNQRAAWFLSTNHWQEFLPLNIQEEELLTANQDSDPSTNQDSQLSAVQTHFSEKLNMTTSLVSMETADQNTNPLDASCHQPIESASDSHMVLYSDHSEKELCIYEEIQDKAPDSAAEDDGRVVGGANNSHQSNFSTNYNADSYLSVSQHVLGDVSEVENGATTKRAAGETGSDITTSGNTTQPVYSRRTKNSVTNPQDSFLKPRLMVLSTSL